ncbi:hypothetical protein [Domibacillus sp. A3M-37]|nr:hypothetical protein [Domibacillus sp. A3M-37]
MIDSLDEAQLAWAIGSVYAYLETAQFHNSENYHSDEWQYI